MKNSGYGLRSIWPMHRWCAKSRWRWKGWPVTSGFNAMAQPPRSHCRRTAGRSLGKPSNAAAGRIAIPQSPAADRPAFMAVTHHAVEHSTRTQRFFGDAGEDGIAVLDPLLVDDPAPQLLASQPGGDPIGYRIDVVGHRHVHHDPAARREAGADGVAGLGIELIFEVESRSADVDRNAVVIAAVIEHETSKIGNDAGQVVRELEKFLREDEADRVVVDD